MLPYVTFMGLDFDFDFGFGFGFGFGIRRRWVLRFKILTRMGTVGSAGPDKFGFGSVEVRSEQIPN
jgi:hypothetical protein